MNQMQLLATALDYMEQHLCDDIRTEDVARGCYCSKSTLEKLFRCVNNLSIHDYLVRRRMTMAARMIHKHPEKNILDIALEYGYSTNESFTRAFKEIWNCKPTEFRSHVRYSELFPRLLVPLMNGDDYMTNRKHVDISELYDLFVTRKKCYFVCCDIKSLVPINQISNKAGDLAILESLKRMNEAAGEEDIVFRIGGDEFALLTSSEDSEYAKSIAKKICAYNNQTFSYEGQEIPLYLYVGIGTFGGSTLKYDELFKELHSILEGSKGEQPYT